MIKQNSAQIHLASVREQRQNCWSTFNFDTKNAFGSLFLFNYQVLLPKQNAKIVSQSDTVNYFLPLYGGFNYQNEQQNKELIATEQIAQIVTKKENSFEISNPFQNNVSYLQMGFKTDTINIENEIVNFNFKKKNKLIPLFKNNIANAFIAHFDGRKEGYYPLKRKQNGIFVYVIQGAFEFENILLESGDALSLKEIEDVEWECLSKNALLLLLEIPLA